MLRSLSLASCVPVTLLPSLISRPIKLDVCYDSQCRFDCNLGVWVCSGSNGRNAAKVVMYEDVGKKQVLQFTSVLRGCRSMLQAVQNFDSCLSELSSTRLRDLLTFGR